MPCPFLASHRNAWPCNSRRAGATFRLRIVEYRLSAWQYRPCLHLSVSKAGLSSSPSINAAALKDSVHLLNTSKKVQHRWTVTSKDTQKRKTTWASGSESSGYTFYSSMSNGIQPLRGEIYKLTYHYNLTMLECFAPPCGFSIGVDVV